MNKASGGDGIPVELFQILKEDAVEVLQYGTGTKTEIQINGTKQKAQR